MTTARDRRLHAPDEILLGFARALRAAGVPVTHDRAHDASSPPPRWSGSTTAGTTYWAGRATLCAGPDDLARYDQVFEAWFGVARGAAAHRRRASSRSRSAAPLPPDERGRHAARGDDRDVLRAAASATEVLRHRDVAALEPRPEGAARRDVRGRCGRGRRCAATPVVPPGAAARSTLAAPCAPRLRADGRARPHRVPPPRHPAAPGRAAGRRVRLDEPVRRRAAAARHRFAVGSTGRAAPVEVFTLGTRLTRVTRALRTARPRAGAGARRRRGAGLVRRHPARRDAERVPRPLGRSAAWRAAPSSWCSATAGNAATPTLLGEQMPRLQPARAPGGVGQPAPRARTATSRCSRACSRRCPHVDDFVAGHSLASFARAAGGGRRVREVLPELLRWWRRRRDDRRRHRRRHLPVRAAPARCVDAGRPGRRGGRLRLRRLRRGRGLRAGQRGGRLRRRPCSSATASPTTTRSRSA